MKFIAYNWGRDGITGAGAIVIGSCA